MLTYLVNGKTPKSDVRRIAAYIISAYKFYCSETYFEYKIEKYILATGLYQIMNVFIGFVYEPFTNISHFINIVHRQFSYQVN